MPSGYREEMPLVIEGHAGTRVARSTRARCSEACRSHRRRSRDIVTARGRRCKMIRFVSRRPSVDATPVIAATRSRFASTELSVLRSIGLSKPICHEGARVVSTRRCAIVAACFAPARSPSLHVPRAHASRSPRNLQRSRSRVRRSSSHAASSRASTAKSGSP